MPIDILIIAAVALALLLKLWSVLGTRNEDEPQRPNPFVAPPPPVAVVADASYLRPAAVLPPASLAGGLAQVKAADAAFDEKKFLQMARENFSVTVEAYAKGAFERLAPLLTPALLAHFRQAAAARQAAGQTAESRVATIRECECVAARAEGTQMFVTVRFVSLQENILRDAGGGVIGGAVGKVEEVTDIWVFNRDAKVAGAAWVVAETGG